MQGAANRIAGFTVGIAGPTEVSDYGKLKGEV